MKQVRYWQAVLLVWFFFLYNIERVSEPFNLATFVYIYTAVISLGLLLLRKLVRLKTTWLLVMALPPYFFMKIWLGYPILGSKFPITVTEVCAILLTILLTRQLIRQLDGIGETVSQITIEQNRSSYPFEIGQSEIYRWIRRARKRELPMSLLAVSVSEDSLKLNIDRFIKEYEKEIIKHYVNARVSNLLVEKLHTTDIVTHRNNHFIILLPETGKPEAVKVVSRLQSVADKSLGLRLKVGVSSFPEEATTFEKLLADAEAKMMKTEPVVQVLPLSNNDPLNKIVVPVAETGSSQAEQKLN